MNPGEGGVAVMTNLTVLRQPRRTSEDAAAVVQGVKTGEVKILPQPVTRTFFSDRIDGLDRDTSAAIVKALTDAGQLDAAGFLKADPRCSTTIPTIRLLA